MIELKTFAVRLGRPKMIYVLAALASLGVLAGLSAALYAWFQLSLGRFYALAARDVLTDWDARLAELSECDREHQRTHPPTEVLEAILDLPSRRPPRLQYS
jgi:hypothetical protein